MKRVVLSITMTLVAATVYVTHRIEPPDAASSGGHADMKAVAIEADTVTAYVQQCNRAWEMVREAEHQHRELVQEIVAHAAVCPGRRPAPGWNDGGAVVLDGITATIWTTAAALEVRHGEE